MLLLDVLFINIDIIAAPLCFLLLMMVFSAIVKKYAEPQRRLFMKAFYFKMTVVLLWTTFSSFYYSGGDSEMYYFANLHMRQAVLDDFNNLFKIFWEEKTSRESMLFDYMFFDESRYPVYEAMKGESNFIIPKLALPFSLLFAKSYLCISMSFAFFALGGAIRLYKFFSHFYPQYSREISFATLFLPSAVFWSSGMLKDPICFGSVGYMVYAVFNMVILKRKYVTSLLWIAISVYFLFTIKVYILLALVPGLLLWVFSEINKLITDRTLRNIFAVFTLAAGVASAFFLISYATSDDSVKNFRFDTVIETSNYNRNLYAQFSKTESGAYYSIQTSNPVLIFLNGISATLFRPFPWEISSPIVALSVLEAMIFLFFTMQVLLKRGVKFFFNKIFSTPVFIMCFVFSMVFAAAVGSTATNFGSLSRYKIPCLPFYLFMVMVMYREAGLTHPDWFQRLLGYKKKFNRLTQAPSN